MRGMNLFGAKPLVAAAVATIGVALTAVAAVPTPCKGCFAVVNADGGFNRGKGVVRVEHRTTGYYILSLNKPVDRCGYLATIGRADIAFEPPGFIKVAKGLTSTSVVVLITSIDNFVADRGFHLGVFCP